MTPLFRQIEGLIPTLQGWATVAKAQHLASMVIALHAKTSVEIGVFSGRSLFGMALAHKHIGHGHVIGIDPWTSAAATEGYTGENRDWWGSLSLEKFYQDFVRKVSELGCNNVVSIQRKKSDDATLPETIDLCHCDGQHSEQALRDVKRYAPKIRVGGLIVLDDMTWVNNGIVPVPIAADWLRQNGFIELQRIYKEYPDKNKDDYGVMQRIK